MGNGGAYAPAWIQAAAAVGSLAVTAWLARITKEYADTTREISAATSRQVEHALELARRQERAIAAALLEETKRISDELGDAPEDALLGQARARSVIPEVHPWMEAIIPRIALADPEVVGLFLRLDRYLSNHRGRMAALEAAGASLEGAEASLRRLEERPPSPTGDLAESLADVMHNELETRQQVRVARHNRDLAEREAAITYRHCLEALGELTSRLEGIASKAHAAALGSHRTWPFIERAP